MKPEIKHLPEGSFTTLAGRRYEYAPKLVEHESAWSLIFLLMLAGGIAWSVVLLNVARAIAGPLQSSIGGSLGFLVSLLTLVVPTMAAAAAGFWLITRGVIKRADAWLRRRTQHKWTTTEGLGWVTDIRGQAVKVRLHYETEWYEEKNSWGELLKKPRLVLARPTISINGEAAVQPSTWDRLNDDTKNIADPAARRLIEEVFEDLSEQRGRLPAIERALHGDALAEPEAA